jgi:hypothetical protein
MLTSDEVDKLTLTMGEVLTHLPLRARAERVLGAWIQARDFKGDPREFYSQVSGLGASLQTPEGQFRLLLGDTDEVDAKLDQARDVLRNLVTTPVTDQADVDALVGAYLTQHPGDARERKPGKGGRHA